MIKNFTIFRIAKHFLLFNIIFLPFSLCLVNTSFAAEEFPWTIFYPAIIKKSINSTPSGFTQDELIGNTFQFTNNDYTTCVFDITFINDHQFVGPDGGTYNYIIENGSIVISDPPVSTTISVQSRVGFVITVSVSVTGGTFEDQTDQWYTDFSSLNNSATELKDWFIENGFWPDSAITSDGHVINQAASFDGHWWIDNNVFYFAYPEADGCVDYKAYKLVNNHLMFATDADNTTPHTMVEK